MIMVGLIEEVAKLIVPLVIGVALCDAGDDGLRLHALLSTRSLAGVEDTLLLRALLSPAGHVAWTGVAVAALWAVTSAPHRGRALARLGGTFLAAVLLHAAWDGFNNLWVHVLVGVGSFLALLLVIRRAQRPEVSKPVRGSRQRAVAD